MYAKSKHSGRSVSSVVEEFKELGKDIYNEPRLLAFAGEYEEKFGIKPSVRPEDVLTERSKKVNRKRFRIVAYLVANRFIGKSTTIGNIKNSTSIFNGDDDNGVQHLLEGNNLSPWHAGVVKYNGLSSKSEIYVPDEKRAEEYKSMMKKLDKIVVEIFRVNKQQQCPLSV